MTLRALDLACGGGGVSAGLSRAGFDVTGVDLVPQPHYPYEFVQADCLELPLDAMASYDLIWLSAPCQRWSRQSRCRPEIRERYPDLITPMRPRLEAAGVPYIMENVEGAPLRSPVMLCGFMFGFELYRHRLFEAGGGLTLPQPFHWEHRMRASKAGHWVPGTVMSVAGHVAPMWKAREIMDISWLPREPLVEAVPPYMAEWAGLQARAQVMAAA
jgi:DNA (cytosine-5)-methyltransferase 1